MPQELTKQLYKIRTGAALAGVRSHCKTATLTIGKKFMFIRDPTGASYKTLRPTEWKIPPGAVWGRAVFSLRALYSLIATLENVAGVVRVHCEPATITLQSDAPDITLFIKKL